MSRYFLLFRSLTYGQRSVRVLRENGIAADLVRSPRLLDPSGCGYASKLAGQFLHQALQVLKQAGLQPKHIFLIAAKGSYEEVLL